MKIDFILISINIFKEFHNSKLFPGFTAASENGRKSFYEFKNRKKSDKTKEDKTVSKDETAKIFKAIDEKLQNENSVIKNGVM